jgi:hypothetical protein
MFCNKRILRAKSLRTTGPQFWGLKQFSKGLIQKGVLLAGRKVYRQQFNMNPFPHGKCKNKETKNTYNPIL